MCRQKEISLINSVWIHRTPTFSLSKQLVFITDDISQRHAVRSYFELPALWMSAKQPLPVSAWAWWSCPTAPFQEDGRHTDIEVHNGPGWIPKADAYQLVFESLPLDKIIHATGAVRVWPANFVDWHATEASASQRQPSTAGVIASHDHCSHTRITVTAKANTHQHIISETFKTALESRWRRKWLSEAWTRFVIMKHCTLLLNIIYDQKEHNNGTFFYVFHENLVNYPQINFFFFLQLSPTTCGKQLCSLSIAPSIR